VLGDWGWDGARPCSPDRALAGGPPRVGGRAWSWLASTWSLARKVNIASSAIAGVELLAGFPGRSSWARPGALTVAGVVELAQGRRQRRDRSTSKLMGGSRTAGGSRSESSGSGNRGNSSFERPRARFPDEERRAASAFEKRTNSSGDRSGGSSPRPAARATSAAIAALAAAPWSASSSPRPGGEGERGERGGGDLGSGARRARHPRPGGEGERGDRGGGWRGEGHER